MNTTSEAVCVAGKLQLQSGSFDADAHLYSMCNLVMSQSL